MPNLNVSGGDSAFYFVPAGSRARIARPRRTVDPRDDLGGNTRVACAIRRRMGIGHENRGPKRDQGIGPQARETLAPLPLEADRRAEAGGDEKIQSGMREVCGHDGTPSEL